MSCTSDSFDTHRIAKTSRKKNYHINKELRRKLLSVYVGTKEGNL